MTILPGTRSSVKGVGRILLGGFALRPRSPQARRRGPGAGSRTCKNHRPDLGQVLWTLRVSADGAVPVAHRVVDGNTPDDIPNIPTFR